MEQHAQQQWEEFECILSMFPNEQELQYDAKQKDQYESYVVSHSGDKPQACLRYSIRFPNLSFGKEIPALEIKYPERYPAETVEFTVQCPSLTRQDMETLVTDLTCIATGSHDDVVVLQLYHRMQEMLMNVHERQQKQADNHDDTALEIAFRQLELPLTDTIAVLGRRAIYFHHIIATNKRRVVMEWALELRLGGFSKIGWPGVVIVEGDEACAQEYVRRLQHLRWKQMVVRGEQTIEGKPGQSLDALRQLPLGFREFLADGMSAIASACRDAGLEELFLSVMKIYNRSSVASDANHNPQTSRKRPSKHTE